MDVETIARVAHEVNRAYCLAMGETGIPMWQHAPEWQRETVTKGVEFHLAHRNATPEENHAAWLAEKQTAGWRWGPVKDVEKKEHPCFRPYAELGPLDQAKDQIFTAVVHALVPLL